MGTKKTSQQSQTAHFNPTPVERGAFMMDVLIDVQNWGYPERTMVSRTLEEDDEYIQNQANIERHKKYVIEYIVKNLDESHAKILLDYINLLEEQHETTVCMADMIAYDLITVRATEDKEK